MPDPALIIIDVQQAIDHPVWGVDRNNPDAEANIARLLDFWRGHSWPVFHVRHLSRNPASPYRPGQPGAEFKPEVAPREGEPIIGKQTNSAFIGTDLEQRLRKLGIGELVITGVITNNSVEASARMAGNLGFTTFVVSDATATFGRRDFAGTWRPAEAVHAMSLANLDGEYASVMSTKQLLSRFGRPHEARGAVRPGDPGGTIPVRLEHANLCVHDIEGVVRFLLTALPELRVRHDAREPNGSRWVHVGNDESYVALTEADPDSPRRQKPYKGRVGLNHLAFEVPDVGSIRARLSEAGYQESTLPNAHPHRNRIYFYDPEGNDWEFVQYLSDDRAERHDYRLPDR